MSIMSRDPLVIGGVIGDVLEPFTASATLGISFDGKVFSNGCDLRACQVANKPRVHIRGGQDFPTTFYTLVLVDPDAPSPSDPYHREYLHWLVADIPGSTCTDLGREVVAYESPRPSTGIHHLVFVLFRQNGSIDAPDRPENFLTREFANVYNLGQPVAAVYYNCRRDSGIGGRRFSRRRPYN